MFKAKIMSKARKFREDIRSCTGVRDLYFPSEDAFYEHLELKYKEAKQKNLNGDLFLIGVGLFTFGRLDVAEDILNNIPGGRGSVNHLAGVLKLLPLPRDYSPLVSRGYNPLENPNAIKEWLRVKYSRLKWDESIERYILENFRVKSSLPPESNCQHFEVPEKPKQQERLILEILPDDGTNWYASFESGQSEFSGVYQHPNRVDLIIISNGQGYIVNPETQQLLETFGGEITETIDFLDSYAILFQDFSGFISYDETGFLWRNQELSWSGIRQLEVDGIVLIGECQRSTDTDWEPFWLNVKTGEIHLEKYDPVGDAIKRIRSQKQPWWKIW